jgi:hypothetical protein
MQTVKGPTCRESDGCVSTRFFLPSPRDTFAASKEKAEKGGLVYQANDCPFSIEVGADSLVAFVSMRQQPPRGSGVR